MTISWIFYRGHDMDSDQFVDAYNLCGQLMVTCESSEDVAKRKEEGERYCGNTTSVTFPISFLERSLVFVRDGYCQMLDEMIDGDVESKCKSILLVADLFPGCGWMNGVPHDALIRYANKQIGVSVSCVSPFGSWGNPSAETVCRELTLKVDIWQDILSAWKVFNASNDWGKITSDMVYQTPVSYTSESGNQWLDS